MSVQPVGAIGGVGGVTPVAPVSGLSDALPAPAMPDGVAGAEFAGVLQSAGLGQGAATRLEDLQQLQATADDLAVKAVTGQLQDPSQYTIAATEATLATQMTVALRNKAVEAYSEVMRMQL